MRKNVTNKVIRHKIINLTYYYYQTDEIYFFFLQYSLYAKLSPSVVREIYQDITGDAVVSNDNISEEMRKRIKFVLQTKDPDIIYDL